MAESPNTLDEQLFRLLRISPSYEQARQLAYNQLPADAVLPPYFRELLLTYSELGDVRTRSFADWHALHSGKPFKLLRAPWVQFLDVVLPGGTHDTPALDKRLTDYLTQTLFCRTQSATLVMALPVDLPRERLFAELSNVLDKWDAKKPDLKWQNENPPADDLWTDPTFRKLKEGVDLLYVRAAHECQSPVPQLWRAGKEVWASTWYPNIRFSEGRNIKQDDSASFTDEQDARRNLTNRTRMSLERFQAVCENAARGDFNNDKAPEGMPEFDLKEIHRMNLETERWEAGDRPPHERFELEIHAPMNPMLALYRQWQENTGREEEVIGELREDIERLK